LQGLVVIQYVPVNFGLRVHYYENKEFF